VPCVCVFEFGLHLVCQALDVQLLCRNLRCAWTVCCLPPCLLPKWRGVECMNTSMLCSAFTCAPTTKDECQHGRCSPHLRFQVATSRLSLLLLAKAAELGLMKGVLVGSVAVQVQDAHVFGFLHASV
jgi:hypothetical protein